MDVLSLGRFRILDQETRAERLYCLLGGLGNIPCSGWERPPSGAEGTMQGGRKDSYWQGEG